MKVGLMRDGSAVIGKLNEDKHQLEEVLRLEPKFVEGESGAFMVVNMIPLLFPFATEPLPVLSAAELAAMQDPSGFVADEYYRHTSNLVLARAGDLGGLPPFGGQH